MKHGRACRCLERKKSLPRRAWVVLRRDYTVCGYSMVRCLTCKATWRTINPFADRLPDAEEKEW